MRQWLAMFALLVATIAAADDANWMAVGSAGNFTNNKFVQMVREDVRIRITDSVMHVDATFWFQNHGPTSTVTMAFPDETTTNNYDAKLKRAVNVIRRIRSTVDGVPTKLTRKPLTHGTFAARSAWLKNVIFRAGQRRKVTVTYTADHGFAGNGWIFDEYVLETGSTWRGSIVQCDIDMDWDAMKTYSRPLMEFGSEKPADTPKTTWRRLSPHHAHITLHNIRPKFNLNLSMITGFWSFSMNGKRMEQNLGLADDGPTLRGPHRDLLIPVANLPTFFGKVSDGAVQSWGSSAAATFGRNIEVVDSHHLRLGGRRIVRIKRRVIEEPDDSQAGLIHLRDLVRTLGGSYSYVAADDRVDIWIPARRM